MPPDEGLATIRARVRRLPGPELACCFWLVFIAGQAVMGDLSWADAVGCLPVAVAVSWWWSSHRDAH